MSSDSMRDSVVSSGVLKADTSGRTVSLFPKEPPVYRADRLRPHLSVTDWLRQWIEQHDAVGLAHRIMRAERAKKGLKAADLDGDPLGDLDHLRKILKGDRNRHFSIDWIWHIRDEFGVEALGDLFETMLDAGGFLPPVRKPDPLVLEQRIAERNDLQRQAIELLQRVAKFDEESR